MSKIVLDASALLAIIHEERGSEVLNAELLSDSSVSTVNLAEVQSKLVSLGWPVEEAWADARSSTDDVVPFSPDQAKTAGSLIAQTRPFGLSLGDRACLALALSLKAPVYTADRSWKNLKLGVRVHLIR
jgi:PIN domain nuclease of toxin-antitoxin system